MTTGHRVAIYARVSTRDQKPENQLLSLRDYAAQRGWSVIGEFVDRGISGAQEQRPELGKLMLAARRRYCDIVLVWRFDRFARSAKHLLTTLEELRGLDIDFVSFQEAIDTRSPAGKVLFNIVAAIAEFERSLIRERVMAGLDRARAQGKQLGRPRAAVDGPRIAKLRREGLSLRQIARQLELSKDAVARSLSQKPR
jgi:DNA invertase Pin-like site-specific DNA recombinase